MLDSAIRAAAEEKAAAKEQREADVAMFVNLLGLACYFTAGYHFGGWWGLLFLFGLCLVIHR